MPKYLLILILSALIGIGSTKENFVRTANDKDIERLEIECISNVLDTLVSSNIDWWGPCKVPVQPIPLPEEVISTLQDSFDYESEMKKYRIELAKYKESKLVKVYVNDTLFNRGGYLHGKKQANQNRIIDADSIFANRTQDQTKRVENLRKYPREKADITFKFSRVIFNEDLTKGDFIVDYKGKFTSDTLIVTVIKGNTEWRIE
ncbi:hypothetical protein GYB22_02290 [bacterium]|nr:hypothetical protein [bacterium]